jgi:hypothetical protein
MATVNKINTHLMTRFHVGTVVEDPDCQGGSVGVREQGNVHHGPHNIPEQVSTVKLDYTDNIVLHAFT